MGCPPVGLSQPRHLPKFGMGEMERKSRAEARLDQLNELEEHYQLIER